MPPIDLNQIRAGNPPLYLHPDGRLSTSPTNINDGPDALNALILGARWVSGRRTVSFEQLFPPSPFNATPPPPQALSLEQGANLLAWLQNLLKDIGPQSTASQNDALQTGQMRSAILTLLSHIIATRLRAPAWAPLAAQAANTVLALVNDETGPQSWPALRAHGIWLLQSRGPALSEAQATRARQLLQSLIRPAPPYDTLKGPWEFASCSAWDFHDGECTVLLTKGFVEVPPSLRAPLGNYRVFEAPFKNCWGEAIRIHARSASPGDENLEMANPAFIGLLINRHAQLGSFDMRAATTGIRQQGYKLMMNSQCAGLTTRFAISRMFPDADLYSSWDSTYFRTDSNQRIIASEGVDCFVAMLQGMSARESHSQLSTRIQRSQWYHEQKRQPGFVQFVGPSHPAVIVRYQDINADGRADNYDGYLDLQLKNIAEDVLNAGSPRPPLIAPSGISGDAATGLNWAVGSLNRVTQYSDLWDALPGVSEGLYLFSSGGFFDHHDLPADLHGILGDPGHLPVICSYRSSPQSLSAEIYFHAHLSHAPKELKRLLCTAEALNRAYDLGLLSAPSLAARRAAILLTLTGLLEFPADQNRLDALWSTALKMLALPEISRSVVRACITDADHHANNYYGSLRGIQQLIGSSPTDPGRLGNTDMAAWQSLQQSDPQIGRALPLILGG